MVLDYLPSPTVPRADIVLPTLTLFERSPSSFVNQEGRLQLAPPVHLGGVPIVQVSPEQHPPRTFLSHVPGGEPRTPGEILAELAAALSPRPSCPKRTSGIGCGRKIPSLPDRHPVCSAFGRPAPARGRPGPGFFPRRGAGPEGGAPGPPGTAPGGLNLRHRRAGRLFPAYPAGGGPPRLLMHPEDAAKLGLGAGDQVALRLPGGELQVALQTAANMAPGVMVLPRHRQLNWRLAPDYRVMLPLPTSLRW